MSDFKFSQLHLERLLNKLSHSAGADRLPVLDVAKSDEYRYLWLIVVASRVAKS